MSLNDIYDEISKSIQEAIDAEILESLMCPPWTVVREPSPTGWDSDTTTNWCQAHCQGDHKVLFGRVLFEQAEDAAAFGLSWT